MQILFLDSLNSLNPANGHASLVMNLKKSPKPFSYFTRLGELEISFLKKPCAKIIENVQSRYIQTSHDLH